MSVMPGTKLGPYEIVAAIGSGGIPGAFQFGNPQPLNVIVNWPALLKRGAAAR